MRSSQKTITTSEWKSYSLGELGEYLNGRAFKSSDWEKTGLPIIRIQNLNDREAMFNYTSETFEDRYNVESGDLLVSWSASLGAYIWNQDRGWLNQHIFKVRVNENIVEKKLLYYAIRNVIRELYAQTHGSGIVHVTKPVFEAQAVVIPTKKWLQTELATRLDEMESSISTSTTKLKTARRFVTQFRQSVLSAAVTGKLTEEWREKNPSVESATLLLEKIIQEKIRLKKKSKVQANIFATDDIVDLPKSWAFTTLGQVVKEFKYGTSEKSDYLFAGTPVLRIPNIVSGSLDLTNLKYLSGQNTNEDYLVHDGDILIVRSNGSRDLVGKNVLVQGIKKSIVFASYLIKISPLIVNPEYIWILLNSDLAKQQLFAQSKSAAGINNINTQELASITTPLPPLEEQKIIILRVKRLLAIADDVENQIKIADRKTSKLAQSILAKAFRGEL